MKNSILKQGPAFLLTLFLLSANASLAAAQTTTFAYEGHLSIGGFPADGDYDFEFKFFDDLINGAQQGATLPRLNVTVKNGGYAVTLDFGAAVFSGADRFLEISYRAAGGGAFTVLNPRQQMLSAPYAIKSLNAGSADALSPGCVNCVTSGQIGSVNGNALAGQIPVASVPANSGNYIQNTTSQQASADFNISGAGTASAFNATTQYNIGGKRILAAADANIFAGVNAGASNTAGGGNSFFGFSSGLSNTTASDNSFFGAYAGKANTTGGNNAFFGNHAGSFNATASDNSFFGVRAGGANTTGENNSFFGSNTGGFNTTGGFNSFFGATAGKFNTDGENNSFFGAYAGLHNSEGNDNSFFGMEAGDFNTSGPGNSFFGKEAGLHNTTGAYNAFVGLSAGAGNTTGGNNAFVGYSAGQANTSGAFNTFFGAFAGYSNTTGNSNTVIGKSADVTAGNLNFATAIGSGATVSASNTVVIGRSSDSVRIPGSLVALTLGVAGSTQLCRNASSQIATCSSSLRYKRDVRPFAGGLDIVRRLRPISFTWRDGAMRDIGFGAEEVEQVEPLLATRNSAGEIEGVKYGQVTAVLVNAINQQQTQIATQQRIIEQQQLAIEREQSRFQDLKRLVCLDHPKDAVCLKKAD